MRTLTKLDVPVSMPEQDTNYPERQLEYHTARRKLKKAIRESKRDFFLDLCDSTEFDPWGKAYKIVVQGRSSGQLWKHE